MNSEVFRFVTLRPAEREDDRPTDDLILLGPAESPFLDTIRKLRRSGDRPNIDAQAREFTASDDFAGSPRTVDPRYGELGSDLAGKAEGDFAAHAKKAVSRNFDASAADLVASDSFHSLERRTTDSIVAAAIDLAVSPRARTRLVTLAKTIWVIRRVATGASLSRSAFRDAHLVLPIGIFPLPFAGVDVKGQRRENAEARASVREERRRTVKRLSGQLAAFRRAASETLEAFEREGAQPTPSTRRATSRRLLGGFVLAESTARGLSDATRDVLADIGLADGAVDVARAVTLLERRSADAAHLLYSDPGATRGMVRIGNRIVPSDLFGDFPTLAALPEPGSLRSPGPCPPAPLPPPTSDDVTVPTGHGEAKVLGIADLMVLEQDLLRYQLGEIAHIENVLRSEVRSRTFRTTSTTERSTLTETEVTEEKERDLSSTERFELQTESQTIITENASREAGLTISASYGPSVEATSNFNYAASSSKTESDRSASSFAREIATRAVSRVQSRALTRRFVRTVDEIEETNRHAFENNAQGATDIVGVYRFVDKIYRAQVVNYGKRLMLEFVVPEPAAFLRYAMAQQPMDGVVHVRPEPPGYCLADGKSFAPLQAQDIEPDNYLYWASKYGAQDVGAPPPPIQIATFAKKAPDQLQMLGQKKVNSDLFDVTIPDGYLANTAYLNLYGETQAGPHKIVYQIQDLQGQYTEPTDDAVPFLLRLQPTPTLTVTINSIGFHNYEVICTVLCKLSPEKYDEWKLKTYTAIMSAYNDLESRYNQAIQEARLEAGDSAVSGSNPTENREIERTELKKGCISILTGQRFDAFDAVARNVAPFGYPEIDFAEARAESVFIQTFEQSFEWNNMTYLFYPYFWGRKDEWVTISQLSDDDALFGRFLQAGAARVQVPVRRGFEESIITYLGLSQPWPGEGSIVHGDEDGPDELHLSVLDELKSQTGNNNTEGVGTLSVTQGSVTVAGAGTAFTADDRNRRISIRGVTHLIRSVAGATSITLDQPYAGATESDLHYATGGKLVGEPWEVKLPTNLVKLDASLPIA